MQQIHTQSHPCIIQLGLDLAVMRTDIIQPDVNKFREAIKL